MSENHAHAKVTRIDEIPTQFYIQNTSSFLTEKHRNNAEALSDGGNTGRLSFMIASAKTLWQLVIAKASSTARAFFCLLHKKFLKGTALAKNMLYDTKRKIGDFLSKMAFSSLLSLGIGLCSLLLLFATCTFGCSVSINDRHIGVVKNKEAYETLLAEINTELDYVIEEEFSPGGEPSFMPRLIFRGKYTDDFTFKEQLKATSWDMLPAYSLFVDGEMILSLTGEQAAKDLLTNYKAKYVEGKNEASAAFCEDVSVSYCYVPRSSLTTLERATDILEKGRILTHPLQDDETLETVAQHYGITLHSILEVNSISDINSPGLSQLKIPTGKPFFSIMTKERKAFEEAVPFTSREVEDASRYTGTEQITQEGLDGVKFIDAYITAIDGKEVHREVIFENLLSAPREQIVSKGTKEPPSPTGTGVLTKPVNATLSSRFGSRWGRKHEGIDLCGAVGTEIYAADNGTIVYAEYNNGGYGYMVQIDHGNGLMTYYAHCNELFVSLGDVVAKGDLIASLGNTGRSTGPHLHFEVRKNGTAIDPLNFISE